MDRIQYGLNVRWTRPDGSVSQLMFAKVVATSVQAAEETLRASHHYLELEWLTKGATFIVADVSRQPATAGQEPLLVFERPRTRVRRCLIQLVAQHRLEPKHWEVLGGAVFKQQLDGEMEIEIQDPQILMAHGDYVLLDMDGRLIRGHVISTRMENLGDPIYSMDRMVGFASRGISREYTIRADVQRSIDGPVAHVLKFPRIETVPPLKPEPQTSAQAVRTQEGIWDRRARRDFSLERLAEISRKGKL